MWVRINGERCARRKTALYTVNAKSFEHLPYDSAHTSRFHSQKMFYFCDSNDNFLLLLLFIVARKQQQQQ